MIKVNFLKKLTLVGIFLIVTATNASAENKINVFVSILPQQYFVQQVGGEHVNVHVMVGPGQSPATYEPTPQQMAALAKADLYFNIGVPFEKVWIDKIKSNAVVIECCEILSDIEGHAHDEDHIDPHVWTSPKKVIQIVKLIEAALVNVDTKNTDDYVNSSKKFISELDKLDKMIKSKMSSLKNRTVVVSHPSWGYFAEEYGLTQLPIEHDGKEIQAKSMVKLIQLSKEKNIKAVFVQSQFNDKAAKIIAKEIGATVFELNPLAFNYIDNMNNVVNKIVTGLSYE